MRIISKFSTIIVVGYIIISLLGHFSKQKQEILAPYNEKYSLSNSDDKLFPLVRLLTDDKDSDFFCSGFVIDETYVVTAAHCVKGVKTLVVQDVTQQNNTKARVVGAEDRVDLALVKGDFSKYNAMQADFENPVAAYSKALVSCGYPLGQNKFICLPFMNAGPYSFGVAGAKAPIYPGMSGGPVIDIASGKVVGLNTAALGGASDERWLTIYISPLVGFLGLFKIDKKLGNHK